MSLLRTSYSFGFALGRLETAIARLKELHWPAAPICDRASTFGDGDDRLAARRIRQRHVNALQLVDPLLPERTPVLVHIYPRPSVDELPVDWVA